MIRYLKKAIPISILASGIMVSASFADTFTLRVGSGHPSKPTAYVGNMEKVLVPNIKKRVAAETNHKVRIIEAYAGKIVYVLKQQNYYRGTLIILYLLQQQIL
jgi:C4-dicarboxylate-binding protein DctP